MIRNLKALGLAFVAVFAMSAVVASAAQATPTFTAPVYPATVTAHSTNSDNVFTINKGAVKCKTHHFHATTNGSTTTLTVLAEYKECTFIGLNATVTMNGCHYVFHLNNEGPPYKGFADVVCPEGKKIVVKSLSCTAEVGGQTGLNEIGYENIAEGDVKVTANVTGISYTTSGTCGASSASDGTYKGTAVAEGFEEETGEPQEVMIG